MTLEELKRESRAAVVEAYFRAGRRPPGWRTLDPNNPADATRLAELRALAHRVGTPYSTKRRETR